jgi:hypothetical protein
MATEVQQQALYSFWPKQKYAFDLIFSQRIEQLLYGGAAGGAKDLTITTPIPTPAGWVAMGDLQTGDMVLDESGRPSRVVYAHPFLYDSAIYRLTFDDGTEIEAGAEHLWLTFAANELAALTRRDPEWRAHRRERRLSRATGRRSERFTAAVTERNQLTPPPPLQAPAGTVRRTDEIAATLRTPSGRANHAVPVAEPLELPEKELPLDPYLLGVWLGDGSSGSGQVCTPDAEIEAAFIAAGYPSGKKSPRGRAWSFTARGLVGVLRAAGVLGDKHIPPVYLRASRDQRLALLQGLMDSDGSVADSGAAEFTNTNRHIIDGAQELVVSLGWKVQVREFRAMLYGKDCGPAWRIKWTPSEYVFRLYRKRSRQRLATRRTTKFRYIVSCERIPTVKTRCITVANPSGLFLAGRSMVPTHNSHFARGLAAYVANLWPGSDFAIFRRTDAELQANHVAPWLEEVDPFVPGGRWFQQKMQYVWPSPAWCWCEKAGTCAHSSVTAFRHVDDNRGVKKHQGAEFAGQAVDEATHFAGPDIDYLFTRIRASESQRVAHDVMGPDGKAYRYPGWPGWLKLQLLTANPGDIGHQYMLDTFIDPEEGLERLRDEGLAQIKAISDGPHSLTNENGWTRWLGTYHTSTGEEREITVDVDGGQRWTVEIDLGETRAHVKRAFVPARLRDNPALDPVEYAANLAIGSAENRQRLLNGDWGYAEDAVFKTLSPEVHQVDTRKIFGLDRYDDPVPCPYEWPRAIGQDHGTAKPTAAIWVCQEEEGFLIAYQEYYQSGPVGQHVREIKGLMDSDGHPELVIQADPRLWHRNQGVDQQISVAEIYAHLGEPPVDPSARRMAREGGITMRAARIEDKAALLSLEMLLEPEPDRLFPYWHPKSGQGGAPRLFIAKQCRFLWRELTNLKHPGLDDDGHYQEGLKNGQPDHAYDALKRVAGPFQKSLVMPSQRRVPVLVEAVSS